MRRLTEALVGIGEKGVFDNNASPAASFENFDEVLEKEKGSLARLDGEVLLHLRPLFTAKRRISNDDVEAVALLGFRQACLYAQSLALQHRAESCS